MATRKMAAKKTTRVSAPISSSKKASPKAKKAAPALKPAAKKTKPAPKPAKKAAPALKPAKKAAPALKPAAKKAAPAIKPAGKKVPVIKPAAKKAVSPAKPVGKKGPAPKPATKKAAPAPKVLAKKAAPAAKPPGRKPLPRRPVAPVEEARREVVAPVEEAPALAPELSPEPPRAPELEPSPPEVIPEPLPPSRSEAITEPPPGPSLLFEPVAAPAPEALASPAPEPPAEPAPPEEPIPLGEPPAHPPEATMAELLERLDRWLSAHRPVYYAHLQPGAPDDRIKEVEEPFRVPLPVALKALYRWKNGQTPANRASLQYNRMFLDLDGVGEAHEVNTEMLLSGDFSKPNWWSARWFPFLDNGAGDLVCVDLEGTFTGKVGQVLEFNHDWEARTILFPSLDAWLAAFVVSLEHGMWEESASGFQPIGSAYDEMVKAWYPEYPIRTEAG
jgi:cell wall assembly regulator SMI1